MSADVIGMIISLFAFAVAMLGGVAWLLSNQTRRVDARFDRVDARFDRVDARLDKLDTRIGGVEGELVDVKIAIARLEGPERRLQRL